MTKKKDAPKDWQTWQTEFSEAARAWERLVPRSARVRVADRTTYLVRGPAGTPTQLAALGWEFTADGVRSMHPTPNRESPLALANRSLSSACSAPLALPTGTDADLARQLKMAVAELIQQLRRITDPATQDQLSAVRLVDDAILAIRTAEEEEKAKKERELLEHSRERARARMVAEELHSLQDRPRNEPTAAERALQERAARQERMAESAFGRDALRVLADLHASSPGAFRQLAAFWGCGGQRWDQRAPAKARGKCYDFARRALSKLVDCGLIERAGQGSTRRGGFRITEDGVKVLKSLDLSGCMSRK